MSTAVSKGEHQLEGFIKDEVLRMYEEVARHPEKEFHFFHGRRAAEMFDYEDDWLDRCPDGAVASFAGVGNPHERSRLAEGETVLDLGSGAGMDSIIAGWQVGASGRVIGVDFNPEMLEKARGHAAEAGVAQVEFRQGTMEDIPAEDESLNVIISNGVVNLSFRKRQVINEMFRAIAPGGRVSFTDIVSARLLSAGVVKDPKLWASWIGGALPEGEMFELLDAAGFKRVRSAVVPGFRFSKDSTRDAAEEFGVKAMLFTAERP